MSLGSGVLPARATVDNAALLTFLEPYFFHTYPDNLKYQTYTYLVIKFLLFSIAAVFIFILVKQGKFWLFRVVEMPKGRFIFPNACEGLLTFAGIYYLCDAIYRGLTIRWFYDQTSLETNFLIFSALRLVPLWTAGFIHVASTGLLWPLNPSQLNPHLWHLFIFGLPLAFLVAILPANIQSNTALNDSNRVYQDLRVQLLANPTGAVSSNELEMVKVLGSHLTYACEKTQIWAYIGAAFIVLLLILTICTSPVLPIKVYHELRRERRAVTGVAEACNENNLDNEDGYSQDLRRSHSTHSGGQHSDMMNSKSSQYKRTTIPSRFLSKIGSKFLYPSNAIPSAELKGKPTRESRLAILHDFVVFASIQSFCLIALECTMLGVVVYLASRVVKDSESTVIIPIYTTQLQQTSYIYHVVEIWSVIILGTPLVILMLYRQCFPIKVEVQEVVRFSRIRSRSKSQMTSTPPVSPPTTPIPVAMKRLSVNAVSEGLVAGHKSELQEIHNSATTSLNVAPSSGTTIGLKTVTPKPQLIKETPSKLTTLPPVTLIQKYKESRAEKEAKSSSVPRLVIRGVEGGGVGGGVGIGGVGDEGRFENSMELLRPLPIPTDVVTAAPSTQDFCGYVGSGAGRSIVLDAIHRANSYHHPVRRNAAPWQMVSSEVTLQQLDVERGEGGSNSRNSSMSGLQYFATPHGAIEGGRLSQQLQPEGSSQRQLNKTEEGGIGGVSRNNSLNSSPSKQQQSSTSTRPRSAQSGKSFDLSRKQSTIIEEE